MRHEINIAELHVCRHLILSVTLQLSTTINLSSILRSSPPEPFPVVMAVTLVDVTLLSNLSTWSGDLVLLHPTVAHTGLITGHSISIEIHSPQVKFIFFI